jgi:hypothetical protein
MSWLVSAKQYIPAVIGEPFGGGFFAGYISHTADGNPTHALIVAPGATGATGGGYTLTTNLAWKTATTTTSGTTSAFDGAANTAAMVTAGIADHPAAEFCVESQHWRPHRLVSACSLRAGHCLLQPQAKHWGKRYKLGKQHLLSSQKGQQLYRKLPSADLCDSFQHKR